MYLSTNYLALARMYNLEIKSRVSKKLPFPVEKIAFSFRNNCLFPPGKVKILLPRKSFFPDFSRIFPMTRIYFPNFSLTIRHYQNQHPSLISLENIVIFPILAHFIPILVPLSPKLGVTNNWKCLKPL